MKRDSVHLCQVHTVFRERENELNKKRAQTVLMNNKYIHELDQKRADPFAGDLSHSLTYFLNYDIERFRSKNGLKKSLMFQV